MNNHEPNYEKAFDEFYGTNHGCIIVPNRERDSNNGELVLLTRADKTEAFNVRYMSVMHKDYPNDFADDDPFTSALLDWCENKENDYL